MERIVFLKNVEMFKNVDTEKLFLVAKIAREIFFKKGYTISKQGEKGDAMYIVKSGTIRVIREQNENRTLLNILKEGDSYGTWGLFGNYPRTATAQVNEDCSLLMIRKDEFKDVLYENPEIAYNLLEIYSELLSKANKEIAVLNRMLK